MLAAMKTSMIIPMFRLETICCRLWALLVVFLIAIDNIDAIRVYEGTNIPAPVPKSSKTVGVSKKALYISKRSWSPTDEKIAKIDSKNFTKKSGVEGPSTLYKIKFTEKNYMQYLRYIKDIPRLEEYTFCLWYKSENLSHDQTLFTYSLNKNELLLRFWISAIDSTFRMAIRENQVYKVPVVIRENKWYHICQSWNGVLGEWQLFLDGKRIGAGVLSHYKGTFIPDGGEVTLGQELIGLNKRLNDGIDGEIFGFNLVDEAVPHDQGIFINSQNKPNVQVPPFKKLPPIKKTYQEIKAYISSLPIDPLEVRKKNEGYPSETTSVIKKPKETYSVPPKRNRGNHRLRYPPLRKVVVYNREDRQLPLAETLIELNKTKPIQRQNQTVGQTPDAEKENQPVNINYSIHSYRSEKNERKTNNYEIYEVLEDDEVKTESEEELTNEQSLERKVRENFNLFTAREANKVYTLSNSVKNSKKPKFHFETRTEEPEKSNRSSFDVEEMSSKAARGFLETATNRTSSEAIPVYETEINMERKRRSTDGVTQSKEFTNDYTHPDSNGFRRLPQIPDSFINIFTKNATQSEIEKKLNQYFPKNNSSEETNIVALIPEALKTSPVTEDTIMISLPDNNDAQINGITTESPVPSFLPIPPEIPSRDNPPEMEQPIYGSGLTNQGPVNFPVVQEYNSKPIFEMRLPLTGYDKPFRVSEPAMERRRFDMSSGTDLVVRSYAECTVDRGSPVRDKKHLVLSWADTPVRIFGGAQVEEARNQCGNF